MKLENIARALLLVLTAILPFELWTTSRDLSILQLLFIATTLFGIPIVVRDWKRLLANRFVIAAGGFVLVFWLTAFLAEGFRANSIEAAVRVTCGFILMCVAICVGAGKDFERALCWTAIAAAAYGLLDYWGFGIPSIFRGAEFYVQDFQRLSGSFEYPTTAASFYAMSLPLVWAYAPALSIIVWLALVLTVTRGASAALVIVPIVFLLVQSRRRPAIEGSLLRLRGPLGLAAVGVAVFTIAAVFHPFFTERFQPLREEKATTSARYDLQFNQLTADLNIVGRMPVVVRNTGSLPWKDVVLSFHWYDTRRRRLVPVSEIVNPLPGVVAPNQAVSLDAAFRTPGVVGSYLLDWDLRLENGWLSIVGGVPPGIVEARIESGVPVSLTVGDTTRWYGPAGPSLDATVGRWDLWRAGIRLFQSHPVIGIGPDNFRLRYGQALGYARWDTNVRANSLYVELLSGCGILGLIAFGVMIASIQWNVQPAAMAVAVFLVHGLVDTFLMTTPIYFAFWLLLGRMNERRV